MKLRWLILLGLALLVVALVSLRLSSSDTAQQAVEKTRLALQQQGFKTDLAEFNFSTSDEMRVRVAALTNASTFVVPRSHLDFARHGMRQQVLPQPMQTTGPDSAIPVWKFDEWPVEEGAALYLQLADKSSDNVWSALREAFNDDGELLDKACAAALTGPIRFHLDARQGSGMLLPHLAALKNLVHTLGCRAVLELHDGNKDAAWTNLLGLTRLVTAYVAEPAEISHLARFACAAIAYQTTWQVLQARCWSDEQLEHLQHEWEDADFFKTLPETAAFSRASAVAMCQQERREPLGGVGAPFPELVRSPRTAWYSLKDFWQRIWYRHYGTYEDEKALLLHYRDRELELRQAVNAPTWTEMRRLPGVTNAVTFRSKYPSRMGVMMNLRQLSLAMQMYLAGQGRSLLGRAAETEARRRLVVTAIALERHRGRRGSYPETLKDLEPRLLKNPPTDFMDGQPLRYRLTEDGHFVLYSVGLDCIDNGGVMHPPQRWASTAERRRGFGSQLGSDLVWPRPATEAELAALRVQMQALRQERTRAQYREFLRELEERSAREWILSPRRQARVKGILATKWSPKAENITYEGRPLKEVIRNKQVPGTENLSLAELLTPRQVITGDEPERLTFEFPVCYDAITDMGFLLLLDADLDLDSMYAPDSGAQMQERIRATNGNCLLVWHAIFDPPGEHALQVQISGTERSGAEFWVRGPAIPVVSSNLCQFSLTSAYFDPEAGVKMLARLPEPNAHYTVELTTTNGTRLKTITGSTSNGVIEVYWDLVDDQGKRRTEEAFNSLFDITLPDSGRSQTLRGP